MQHHPLVVGLVWTEMAIAEMDLNPLIHPLVRKLPGPFLLATSRMALEVMRAWSAF